MWRSVSNRKRRETHTDDAARAIGWRIVIERTYLKRLNIVPRIDVLVAAMFRFDASKSSVVFRLSKDLLETGRRRY